MVISRQQKEAKAYAARHDFICWRVQPSAKHPNGYIKVINAKGIVHTAIDWSQAKDTITRLHIKGGGK